MLQHFIIQCTFHYLSSSHLQEVKNKRKFQLSPLKVVMVTCESWSCTRAGHNWSVNVLTHVSISFRRVKGSPKNLK